MFIPPPSVADPVSRGGGSISRKMHSFLHRVNALVTFAVTILAVICCIASITDTFNVPSPSADVQDYTGAHVTAKNLYAVLLGDKTAVEGGSGKVIDSGQNDHIFIYYADHGGPGMPNMPFVYANDFIEVLKNKHKSGSYKEMVIYVEACEGGSIFEGMMPEHLNIYVTTTSNADESSWGTYCPGMDPPPHREYITCLGDLYSIAWMEDSETHNLKKETIQKQYEVVKERTTNHYTYDMGSHVMEYGNKSIKPQKLYLYQGFDPSNVYVPDNALRSVTPMGAVNQRDADLLFLWKRVPSQVLEKLNLY